MRTSFLLLFKLYLLLSPILEFKTTSLLGLPVNTPFLKYFKVSFIDTHTTLAYLLKNLLI